MDNIVALSYLVKMGDTRIQLLVQISKEIWEYLLGKEITITGEYLPGALNKEADMQSRTVKDSSEWKLNTVVFQNLCKSWWTPDIDLFASTVFHQVPAYVYWKLDPYSKRRDAFQMCWTHTKGYAFPPIFSNRQSPTQSFDRSSNVNFDNTSMTNPVLVPSVTKALDSKPFDFAQSPRFITKPKQGTSSSNNKRKPVTPGMDSFREKLSSEGMSKESATLIANAKRSGTITHYESSWRKWHSWCGRRQIDPIKCPLTHIFDSFNRVLS